MARAGPPSPSSLPCGLARATCPTRVPCGPRSASSRSGRCVAKGAPSAPGETRRAKLSLPIRAWHQASSGASKCFGTYMNWLLARGRLYCALAGHPMTIRLYLEDAYRREFDARVLASADGWCALSQTAFYPGGGGQPCDRGRLLVAGDSVEVAEVREGEAGGLWHRVDREAAAGAPVRGVLDWPYRYALMRHHALMHVVNAVARRDFDGL